MLRGRRGDGAPVAPSRARPSSRSDKSRGGSRGWWFSGWARRRLRPPGSSSKRARKAASREALRRRAERRVYKPASFLILFKLACMYVGLTALLYSDFFLAALGCYVNPRARTLDPAGDYLWNVLCCFSLLGLPVLLLHLAGYVFLPPVWPEHFPDRDKALEELGGKLYFRFHRRRRGNPNAARRAVEVAVEVLSRTLPSTLWEVEVLTEDDASRLASANVREFVLPPDRVAAAAAWTRGDGNRDDDGVGGVRAVIVRRGAKHGGMGRLGGAHGRGRHPQSTRGGRRGGARRSRIETGGAVAGVETEEPTRRAGRRASRDHAHGQRGGGWGADDVRVDPCDGGGCSRG